MRICILGTPVSSRNRGVLALATSLINLCYRASNAGQIMLVLGNKNNDPAHFRVDGAPIPIPVVHAKMSPRTHPRHHLAWILLMALLYRILPFQALRSAIERSTPWIRTLANASLAGDIRGGDSFSDIYGMNRFLYGFVLAWTVILVRGSIVQFPQTYGPYKSPFARLLAGYLLKHSSVIIARDRASQAVAQQLVGRVRRVLLSPDVAFSLEPVVPAQVELDPPPPRQSGVSGRQLVGACGPIGLNVNGLMYNGGYTRSNMFGLKLDYSTFLKSLIEALLQEHSRDIWLVPHTFRGPESVESDPEACRRVRASVCPSLQQRVRIVTREYDCHEIKGVIGQCDFFVGSRMHACIAALSQGIPCVGVAYSMKFAGVFESVGMEQWVVDARTTTNGEAVERIMALYRHRDEVRSELGSRAQQARERLEEVFGALISRARSAAPVANCLVT